jgi:hypothetical protein
MTKKSRLEAGFFCEKASIPLVFQAIAALVTSEGSHRFVLGPIKLESFQYRLKGWKHEQE